MQRNIRCQVRVFIHRLYQKPALCFGIALCLAGFFTFAELVDEVMEGDSHTIDTAIILFMRDPGDNANPWGPGWFQEMMRDITGLGGIAVLSLIVFASVSYLLVMKKKGLALYVLASVGSGMALSNLLKYHFNRPRPDLVPHDSIVYTASLPSGHAMMSAIVYLTLGTLLAEIHKHNRLKLYFMGLAVIITVLIGISRIYLGVHWPSDVLAGWLAGGSWALMFWLVLNNWPHKRAGSEKNWCPKRNLK